jgi:hypothetical protein
MSFNAEPFPILGMTPFGASFPFTVGPVEVG